MKALVHEIGKKIQTKKQKVKRALTEGIAWRVNEGIAHIREKDVVRIIMIEKNPPPNIMSCATVLPHNFELSKVFNFSLNDNLIKFKMKMRTKQ
jgi:hypothetical protein